MKRYNFSCYASEKQEAVSRTTTTKPQDFVGEARITRFRLSRGSIPIFYLQPSKKGFTLYEKTQVESTGATPTDLVFIVLLYDNLGNEWSPFNVPNNNCNYIGNPTEAKCPLVSLTKQGSYTISCYVPDATNLDNKLAHLTNIRVAYPEKPVFRYDETSHLYYLANANYPIYDWDSMNKVTIGIRSEFTPAQFHTKNDDEPYPWKSGYMHTITSKLQIKEENGFPLFHCEVNTKLQLDYYTVSGSAADENVDSSEVKITSPVLFMSKEALDLLGMNITEMNDLYYYCENIPGYMNDIVHVFSPTMNLKWCCSCFDAWINQRYSYDLQYRSTLQLTSRTEEGYCEFINRSFCCDFDPLLITVPTDIYPVSQILITSDELDFQGESISVDTSARQGVIDPSSLHILKSFFVGISDTVEIDASDFVYIDDSLNQSPVIINNPRICSLTFRVWFLLKTGELQKCILEPGKGFSLQIGIF